MKEVRGDFWDYAQTGDFDILMVTTNGIVKKNGELVMGAGIAKQFSTLFPTLPKELGARVVKYGNRPFLVKIDDCDILSFPTKEHFAKKSDHNLIARCAKEVCEMREIQNARLLSTRPGCGNGKLLWNDVKRLLEESGWDDRFTIVSI